MIKFSLPIRLLCLLFIITVWNQTIFSQTNACWYSYGDGNLVGEIADDGFFIWVCQQNGLLKIDKNTHEIVGVYNLEKTTMSAHMPSCIAIGNDSSIWIGIPGVGLGRLVSDKWTIYDTLNSGLKTNNPIVGPSISEIFVSRSGVIWIGSQYTGIYSFDGMRWTNYNNNNSPMPKGIVNVIREDHIGNIWIGTRNELVKLSPSGTWEVFDASSTEFLGKPILDLLVDKDNSLWIATISGLTQYTGSDWVPYIENKKVNSLSMDSLGNLYIGLTNTLIKKSRSINRWDYIRLPDEFNQFTEISDILLDNHDSIWIVTTGNPGLYHQYNNSWIEVTPLVTKLESSPVYSVVRTSDQRYWIGTAYWGLFRFDGNSDWIQNNSIKSPFRTAGIVDIEEYRGLLILGKETSNEFIISTWDGKTENILLEQKSGTSNSPNFLNLNMQKSGDDLWISTYNGLFKYNGSWEHYHNKNSSLPTNEINDMEIRDNNIWLGTNAGLVKFDGISWTVWDSLNSNIPSNTIWKLDVDEQGKVWFLSSTLTNPNLVIFDGREFSLYSNTHFSRYPSYFDIKVKNEKAIFIGHSEGISTNVSGEWKLFPAPVIYTITKDDTKMYFGSFRSLIVFDQDCTLSSLIGINNHNNNKSTIFPNPFINQFFINLENISKPFKIEVINALGNIVYSEKGIWQELYICYRNNWNDGIYSVFIYDANGKPFRHLALAISGSW